MAGRDTPATTAARRAGVAFTMHEYEHDPKAASYGMEAAEALGLDHARVFKTLVADLDGALTVCIVPVAFELDLRSLGKRARMADTAKAERTTGYIAGGSARSASAAPCRRSSTRARSSTRPST